MREGTHESVPHQGILAPFTDGWVTREIEVKSSGATIFRVLITLLCSYEPPLLVLCIHWPPFRMHGIRYPVTHMVVGWGMSTGLTFPVEGLGTCGPDSDRATR